MQKGQVLIFLLIGILIAAAVGGYLFYTNYRSSVSNRTNNRTKVVTSQSTPQPTLASSTNTPPTSTPSIPSTPITSCQDPFGCVI